MQELLSYLSSIHSLPADLQRHLGSILQIRSLKKKELLLDIGQVCRHIYFVESGLFRCYYLDGIKETSAWFMRERDTIASVGSFYKQQPSYERIQALEPSVVHYISFDQLQFIYQRWPEFNANGRILTEHYYQLADERNYLLRMNTAAEKARYFIQRYPALADRLQRGHIASYLGVTEGTLSRNWGKALKG